MTRGLDTLIATTFASRDAAQAALEAAGGDLAKARKALARKKTTPLSPALGPRCRALLALAKAAGESSRKNGGVMDFIGFGLPPDVAFVQFVAYHWNLGDVDLAGACLHGAGIMTSDKMLGGASVMPLDLGNLASGEAIVFRYDAKGSTLVAVNTQGEARTFSGIDAVLEEIEADAARRGLPTPLAPPAPKKRGRAPGPPVPTKGDDHRVYAGSELLEVELPHANLYAEPRLVLVRPKKKMTLPADDTWLVSREGTLFQLTPEKPSRGVVRCWATPRP